MNPYVDHKKAQGDQHEAVSGGCIAHATRLTTDGGSYFLKYGWGKVGLTFSAEATGLEALQKAESPLILPRVLAVEDETDEHPGFLLMTWIETGVRKAGFWEAFGHALTTLHRTTGPCYGFDADNFIGQSPQRNTWETTWPVFFRHHRLEPQIRMAREEGLWVSAWDSAIDTLYRRIEDLLPALPPASLLHGDLWRGNFLVTTTGAAALIDPAVYFGHREADLAMTELFGGFDASFYEGYRRAWPLEPGYPLRREIYNLYHLLNHLNLFGSSYAGSVAATLQRIMRHGG